MNQEAQQRIVVYFIEEAREHLNTIEQSLLSLRESVHDPELINELFRAAHSIKGGAAMLGFNSIQRVSHRMEDFFKIFRERAVPVDQHLETLLLRGFDTLSMLLEELQSPRGLTEEVGNAALKEIEPIFGETETHIYQLLGEIATPAPPTPIPVNATPAKPPSVQTVMSQEVPQLLMQMLELFKQREQSNVRSRLAELTSTLEAIGTTHNLPQWTQLIRAVEAAVNNPVNDLRNLALIALRDLKQAQQAAINGSFDQIKPSQDLLNLGVPTTITLDPRQIALTQEIPALLRSMLEVFKRVEQRDVRPQLLRLIQSMQALGVTHQWPQWVDLTELVAEIVGDPSQEVRSLALPVLRDLKQAHQLLSSGLSTQVQPSTDLLALRPMPSAPEPDLNLLFDELAMAGVEEDSLSQPDLEPLDPTLGTFGLSEDAEPAAAANLPPVTIESTEEMESLPSLEIGAADAISEIFGSTDEELTSSDVQSYEAEASEPILDLFPESKNDALEPSPLEDSHSMADLFESDWGSADVAQFEGGFPSETIPPEAPPTTLDFSSVFSPSEWEEPFAGDPVKEATIQPQSPEADQSSPPDDLWSGLMADTADDKSDFALTPLELESDAESAFANLFADAEMLAEIEEPPPTVSSGAVFTPEQESAWPTESRGDLADLFDSLVDGDDFSSAIPDALSEWGVASESSQSDFLDKTPAEDDIDAVLSQLWEEPSVEPLASETAIDQNWDPPAPIEDPEAQPDLSPMDELGPMDDFGLEFQSSEASPLGLEPPLAEVFSPSFPEDDFDMAVTLDPFPPEQGSGDLIELYNELAAIEKHESPEKEWDDLASVAPGEPELESWEALEAPPSFDLLNLELSNLELSNVELSNVELSEEVNSEPLFSSESFEPQPVEVQSIEVPREDSIDLELSTDSEVKETLDSFLDQPEFTLDPEDRLDIVSLSDQPAELTGEEGFQSEDQHQGEELTLDLPPLDADLPLTLADEAGESLFSSDWTVEATDSTGMVDWNETSFFEPDLSGDDSDPMPGFSSDFGSLELSGEISLDFMEEQPMMNFGEEGDPSLTLDGMFSPGETSGIETGSETLAVDFGAEDFSVGEEPVDLGRDNFLNMDDLFSESPDTSIASEINPILENFTLNLGSVLEESTDFPMDSPEQSLFEGFAEEDSLDLSDQFLSDSLSQSEDPEEVLESLDDLFIEEGESSPDFSELDVLAGLLTEEEPLVIAPLDLEPEGDTIDSLGDLFMEDSPKLDEPTVSRLEPHGTSDDLTSDDLDELSQMFDLNLDSSPAATDLNGSLPTPSSLDPLDPELSDLFFSDIDPSSSSAEADLAELSALLDDNGTLTPNLSQPPISEAGLDEFATLEDELSTLFFSETEVSTPGESSAAARLDDLAALFDEGESATESSTIFDEQLDALLGEMSPPPSPTLEQRPAPITAQKVVVRPATPAPNSSRKPAAVANQTMRVEVRHLDSLNNLVGELVVNRNSLEQNQGRLRQFLDGLLVRVQQLGELGQRMQDQYDRSLLEIALLAGRSSGRNEGRGSNFSTTSNRGGSSGGRDKLEGLELDQFTPFHALSQEIIELIVRIRESSSDIQFVVDEVEQNARQFRQITTQLQEGLNRARMVPFSQIADRLPRAVRDLSIKTGKQVNLVVDGRETLIDKAILEELYDPMTHLVNNALVHGIETPEDRRKKGKSPEGKITVKAFYQGNQTIIVVSDDGGGIQTSKVKAKAVKLGLLADNAEEDEVYNVLFHPGFSGRSEEEVDDLAGRGVGLDVVRRNINELRGSIQVDSVPDRGTTFTIRLPLTLSISKSMVCISNKALIAFPLDGVEEMLDVPLEEVQLDEKGRPTIPCSVGRLHYQPLADLLSFNRAHSRARTEVYSMAQDEGIIPIVVVQSAGQYVALQVDNFVEEQEIVIKQLRGPAPKPLGIAGATVLGNGRVLPIADIIELVDLAHGRIRPRIGVWDTDGGEVQPTEIDHQPTVLIVDDSITVRELLSMTFNKVGYRVEQARDGQDAWEKLRGGLPCDLVFCDIEMPRMDGLELLSRLREDPALQHLPIAMLTSRGADRHRQMARDLGANAYFTKPYLEEELLTAANRLLKGEVLLTAG